MRLRLTIRDLLWLTLVVALASRWCIEHTSRSNRLNVIDLPMTQPDFDPDLF